VADAVVATVVLDEKVLAGVELILRVEMARITRDFAAREAGPVGERLRQIADVFEGVR
jgi:hypothetical protein